MVIKKCLPLFLLVASSLLLTSLALRHGYDSDSWTEFEECRGKCPELQPGEKWPGICEQRCEQQLRQREEAELREEWAEDNYRQCTQDCQWAHHDPSQKLRCEKQCVKKYVEDIRRERDMTSNKEEPEEKYMRCQHKCQQKQERRWQCEQECQKKYEQEKRREVNYEREEEAGGPNPYHFSSERLETRFETGEGHLKILEKLNERSEHLKGLKNYRISVLEASPGTFVTPHHCDADVILVVTKGKGTISIVRQNNKESYNMELSDMIPVTAGSTVYFVNQEHNNEPFQITKFISSLHPPGEYEGYYVGHGREFPQSYFNAFSRNIIKQSLSATEEQIEKILGGEQQREQTRSPQRVIVRASSEQLKALSQKATSPSRRGSRDTSGPINLRNLTPLYSNDFGKFFEATPDQEQGQRQQQQQKQLQEMNVLVNWAELKQGTIMVPHFNSRASVLVKVVEGSGRMEMACPHLAGQQHQQRRGQEQQTGIGKLQKVTARLSPNDIFVIPAGHPISVIASEGQTLRLVGFGINALNNERIFIAGKDNMINLLDKEAKELAFNLAGSEVEKIFKQPKFSYFVPQQEERKTTHPLNSVLNFAGYA